MEMHGHLDTSYNFKTPQFVQPPEINKTPELARCVTEK
jgi:hypothetical protein